MWTTLLIMAVAVSLEPVRVGMTVLMLNRQKPIQQLLAFLAGGYAMGIGVGIAALTVLRVTPGLGSEKLSVPAVQAGIGAMALVVAAVLATRIGVRDKAVAPLVTVGADGAPPDQPAPPTVRDRLVGRVRALAVGKSLWVAGFSGLGMALPSVDYLAAMAVIHVSGVSHQEQFAALVAFNMVAFAMVEIPLVSYVVAPRRTLAAMSALHVWVRSRTRRDVAVILALVGLLMLGLAVLGL